MKKFIIATVIFIVVALIGVLIDAFFQDSAWESMPYLAYFGLGWLAAGIYVAISNKIDENKNKKQGDRKND